MSNRDLNENNIVLYHLKNTFIKAWGKEDSKGLRQIISFGDTYGTLYDV